MLILNVFLYQYYQAFFRDGECFLHIVSLLNGISDMVKGEELVLNVLQTLTCLLANNDASKVNSMFSDFNLIPFFLIV